MTTLAQAARTAPRAAPGLRTALAALVDRGLREHRRSILTWGVTLAFYGGFLAAIYPSISDSVGKAIESYPKGLKEAFGVGQLDTVEAYLHAELFSLIIPLALAFFTVRAVVRATAGAEEQGYLDTTLSLPLDRRILVAGAFVVAGIAAATVLAVMVAGTFVGAGIAGAGLSLTRMLAGVAGVWSVGLFAAGGALVGAGLLHRAATVTGIVMGSIVAMYAFDIAGKMTDSVAFLRWLSVFRYVGAPMQHGFDPVAFLGVSGAGVVLAVAGAVLFARRDVLR